MLDPQTLIALACLIQNKGSIDTTSLEAQLSPADQAQVQQIIDSGACLPEKLESLLADTQKKVDSGKLKINPARQPTLIC